MSTIIIITPPPTKPTSSERTATQTSTVIAGDDPDTKVIEDAIESLNRYLKARKHAGC